MSTSLRAYLIWILKANVVIWVVNVVLFFILHFSDVKFSVSGYFSVISLFEAGLSFLIGGALAFSGSALPHKAKEHVLKSNEPWSIENLRSSEKRANKYLILGAVLFVECLIVSILAV